jgi:uncharacterized delta-60 repeat protein
MRTTRPPRSVRLNVQPLEGRETPSTGGLLDPTFGSGGVVNTVWSAATDNAENLVIQGDGKIVVVGQTPGSSKTGSADMAVARYNANGTLDSGFGTGGRLTTDFNQDFDGARAAAIQPGTGKLLVAGITRKTTKVKGATVTNDDFALVRYTATGALDTTFGSGGKVETDMGSNGDGAYAMAVQPDGRIILAGRVAGNNYQYLALARYTAAGALDPTFGTGGKVVTNISTNQSEGFPVAIQLQADGRIVVSSSDTAGNFDNDFRVTRFDTNGTLDPTFGSAGSVTTDFNGGSIDYPSGLAIQADGRIVVVGGSYINGDVKGIALARYLSQDTVIGGVTYPAGSLDPTFGSGGKVIARPPQPADPTQFTSAQGYDVAVQADGRLLVAGTETYGVNGDIAERFNSDGTIDTSYGSAGTGISLVPISVAGPTVAVRLQPDGKAVFAATIVGTQGPNDTDWAVFRLLPSAPQIGSFTANPNPAPAGSTVTLDAAGLTDGNVGATVTQVAFYADTNSDGVLDSGDALLGYGTNNNGTWAINWSTTGYTPGTYTLFAQAIDSLGAVGDPVSLSLQLV